MDLGGAKLFEGRTAAWLFSALSVLAPISTFLVYERFLFRLNDNLSGRT